MEHDGRGLGIYPGEMRNHKEFDAKEYTTVIVYSRCHSGLLVSSWHVRSLEAKKMSKLGKTNRQTNKQKLFLNFPET